MNNPGQFYFNILLEIGNGIARIKHRNDLQRLLTESLRNIPAVSHILTAIVNKDGQRYTAFLPDPRSTPRESSVATASGCPVADGVMDLVLAAGQPMVFNLDELMRRPQVPSYLRMNYDGGIREAVFCPFPDDGRAKGALVIFTTKRGSLNSGLHALLSGVASLASTAIAIILANEQIEGQLDDITRYKRQLETEECNLETSAPSDEIVGGGTAMQEVFRSVSQVADTSATVLLLGETGTGKELIARAIHNGSARRERPMIRVNCAALPAALIESELFGHERGSFTDATERRIGKFELANNSTLFLDEIGELPLELQSKLLRALQEKEIERVGGCTTIKVDVRIIAATNRSLHKEVQADNFRSDLFFRLNVFPILIPPLRQRKDDIPALVLHFLQKHAQKNRRVIGFSGKALKELKAYSWPGNVRELEHLVERSLLMTKGPMIMQIQLPANEKDELKRLHPDLHIRTLTEVEREHIIRVLRVCDGKVAGIGGAAEKLRVPSTTLFSKIRRLKIAKGYLDE